MLILPATSVIQNKALCITVTLGLILIVINFALIRQNRELRSLLLKRREHPKLLENGKALPPLSGIDLQGRNFVVDYGTDKRRVVFLIFAPGCEACETNVEPWKRILENVDNNALRIIALSVVPEPAMTREFADRHNLTGLPIVLVSDPLSREEYNLQLTPQTVLVSSKGVVEGTWAGVLKADEEFEVEQSLRVAQ